MKENVVLISQPRSGSTVLFDLLSNNRHPYMDQHKSEFLDCTDTFFPSDKNNKLIWDDEVDNYYWSRDYDKLKKYYQDRDFSDCVYFTPVLNNGIIEVFSSDWNNNIIQFDCIRKEQLRRIDLLNHSAPWTIKVLDYQVDDFNWINRDNTTVIVLFRDLIEKIASHARQINSGVWHTTQQSTPINIQKKIDLNEVMEYTNAHNQFFKMIEVLNPDCVISYEWLLSNRVLQQSKYKKVNIQDVSEFFVDYPTAKNYIEQNAMRPFVLNQNLLEELLCHSK